MTSHSFAKLVLVLVAVPVIWLFMSFMCSQLPEEHKLRVWLERHGTYKLASFALMAWWVLFGTIAAMLYS